MIRKLTLHTLAAAVGVAYFVAFYELAARAAGSGGIPAADSPAITVAP